MSEKRPGRWGRRLRMFLGLVVAFVLTLVVLLWISTDHFRSFGGAPAGARLERMRASKQFIDGKFQNAEPTSLMAAGAYWGALKMWLFGKQMRVPTCPLPLVTDTAARLAVPPASGLRVTWLGHSSTIIEIDGARILTD